MLFKMCLAADSWFCYVLYTCITWFKLRNVNQIIKKFSLSQIKCRKSSSLKFSALYSAETKSSKLKCKINLLPQKILPLDIAFLNVMWEIP